MYQYLKELQKGLKTVVPTYLFDEEVPYPNQEPCFAVLFLGERKYEDEAFPAGDCWFNPFTQEYSMHLMISPEVNGEEWIRTCLEMMQMLSLFNKGAVISNLVTSVDPERKCIKAELHFETRGVERVEAGEEME